ncbi:restriction endonuclease subunit S [Dickeya solani]|uniref:Type I restriction-modification n=1 Tax=Dickeya solani D s0432-1 TaxID=1231725 RepID=A0AAV3KF50_9GAMM|nr:restriction endonuclease subunit S [Dickeya solani]ANE75856.1 hypothetical protein A4U42_11220 [Dickeya solani IPO 2222]AUC43350.1 Type I restriction-modification system, specificity subunit S [Dickeya solani RNS 08.23.3.1.A]AUH08736.1 hypothetical protein BJD21_09820 [Dickeya solani D s0432-1]AUH12725.1 hypothetical protein BJJ98_09785 [Dickeya solani]AYQ46283.1 Type-1 restriction enzyme EcoKI specificity protein [Dickeya solani]
MAGLNKYRVYPEYNCTDTEGLVKLPSQWELKQVRYILKGGSEGTKIGPFGSALKLEDMVDDGVQVYGQENVIKRDFSLGKRRISFNKFKEMRVYEVFHGDILITMMGTSGKCEIVPHDAEKGIIDSHLIRVRVNNDLIIPAFFKLLVDESPEIKHQISIQGKGSIMLGLNSGIIKSLYLPLPSIAEQRIILIFLDYEVTKIDSLIEKQQQLIELLKEKRQAVISHAVTKGLNPDVPMKDSGVEWLGEVPKHWSVTRLGYHAIKIGSGKTPRGGSEIYLDEGVLFLRSQNVYDDGLRVGSSECVFIDYNIHNEMKGTRVLEGDILLNITGGSIGRSCLVPTPFVEANVNQHVCILRFRKNIREFIAYAMKSFSTKEQIEACQVGGNRDGLNFEQTSKINICLPPKEEINAILEYLKIRLPQLDTLEKNSSNMIQLLQERRTALISAAVTGKIDVRDWVAPDRSEMANIEGSPEVNA